MAEFSDLVGEVITAIEGATPGSGEVTFHTESGRRFRLFHEPNTVERVFVSLIDVDNDEAPVIGGPVVSVNEAETEEGREYRIDVGGSTLILGWTIDPNGAENPQTDIVFVEAGL